MKCEGKGRFGRALIVVLFAALSLGLLAAARAGTASPATQPAATQPATQPKLKILDARAGRWLAALPRWSSETGSPRSLRVHVLMRAGPIFTMCADYFYQAPDHAMFVYRDIRDGTPMFLMSQDSMVLFDWINHTVVALEGSMPPLRFTAADHKLVCTLGREKKDTKGPALDFDPAKIMRTFGGELSSKVSGTGEHILINDKPKPDGTVNEMKLFLDAKGHFPHRITVTLGGHREPTIVLSDIQPDLTLHFGTTATLIKALKKQTHLKIVDLNRPEEKAKPKSVKESVERMNKQFAVMYPALMTAMLAPMLHAAARPGASPKAKQKAMQLLHKLVPGMTAAEALKRYDEVAPQWRKVADAWLESLSREPAVN